MVPVTRRPLIVGHSPDKLGFAPMDPAIAGSAGNRLWAMSGIPLQQYLDTFDRINTTPNRNHDTRKMQSMTRVHAESGMFDDRYVLLVGKMNARLYDWTELFGPEMADPFIWQYAPRTRGFVAWVPHTSGLSRHWNDRDEIEKLRSFMQDLLERYGRLPW